MAVSGIQNQPLEITVVGCSRLKDTEWFSRQDPYLCLEYATVRFRTKICTDGGKTPTFNVKFVLPLIEGLREISVSVWNSNTLQRDDFIGSGRILLYEVLTTGYDDSTWTLLSRSGKNAGELRAILHFPDAKAEKDQTKISSSFAVQSYHFPLSGCPSSHPYSSNPAAAPSPLPAGTYPDPPPGGPCIPRPTQAGSYPSYGMAYPPHYQPTYPPGYSGR